MSAVLQSRHAATPADLADALHTEARLLDKLVQVLLRQRDAIAAADVERIDECVHAAHRVLLTLSEAQRRRRALLGTLAGTEDVPLRRSEERRGGTESRSGRSPHQSDKSTTGR